MGGNRKLLVSLKEFYIGGGINVGTWGVVEIKVLGANM